MHDLESAKRALGIIGQAPKLHYALETAARVASTDITVLILGESGSGKESFSKLIHHLSARRHQRFTAINCGALPEGTIDSELFGHEKGAFTGAHEPRKGYFEATDQGTLFLDEVGEMPAGTQARLLRVLENGEFIKVGASKVQKTNVRVIAATNKDLLQRVEDKKFREDLYYRLSTVPIRVPPLRERSEDIEILYKKFARDVAEAYRRSPIHLTEAALDSLLRYSFPGNVRELKNLIERLSILEIGREIDEETLQRYLPRTRTSTQLAQLDTPNVSEKELLYKILFDMRKDVNDLKALVIELLQAQGADHRLPPPLDALRTRLLADKGTSAPSSTPIQEVTQEEEGDMSLNQLTRDAILKVLDKHNGKRKDAAQELGISERTLYRKLKQYDPDT